MVQEILQVLIFIHWTCFPPTGPNEKATNRFRPLNVQRHKGTSMRGKVLPLLHRVHVQWHAIPISSVILASLQQRLSAHTTNAIIWHMDPTVKCSAAITAVFFYI